MKPYTLKLDTVKRKAREAYKAGLLTAQAPYVGDRRCVYARDSSDGVERHCAIGAALPKRVLKAIAEANRLDEGVYELLNNDYVVIADFHERSVINHIQSLHDAWCANPSMGARKYEAKFKQAIGL